MKRALLLLLSIVAAAAAVAAPPARADQSANVSTVASLPLLAAISINFIGDTMFVSTVHGVYAYDVSDPSAPKLQGALPMFIWENEDVDVDPVRKLLFVSRDPRGFTTPAVPGSVFPYGAVHVIDVSDPSNLKLETTIVLPAGHTTTCVNHCDTIWTAGPVASTTTQPADWGGRPIFGTDIRDPKDPKPCPQPIDTARNDGKTDYVHDVQVDAAGVAWVTGQGGVRGYWTSGVHHDPVTGTDREATGCNPVPYAGSGTPESATPSRFMHNAWRDYRPPVARTTTRRACRTTGRRGRRRRTCRTVTQTTTVPSPTNDVLLATEENTVTDCRTSGRFVTYDLRGTYGGEGFKDIATTKHRMKVLDTWTPEHQPGSSGCDSSHYFTDRGDGITANAFYTQGVRFLDVSDPTDIRQVGWFRQSDSNTWAAYWHGGLVYVADLQRGVDVLKFEGSPHSPTVRAPLPERTRADAPSLHFSRDVFGGLCPLRVSG